MFAPNGDTMNATRRILIIDDERAIVNGLALRLQAAGYETLDAGDAANGLEAAVRAVPDLILLDRRLPDADGLSLLETLRGRRETSRIPVVVLSGCAADGRWALAEGADAFLAKPYRGAELIDLVDSLAADQTRIRA